MLHLYPTFDGFLGKIDVIDQGAKQKDSAVDTVVILDRSGSMGSQVARIVNKLLPSVFDKLGYKPDQQVTIIAFDDRIQTIVVDVKELPMFRIGSGGSTTMSIAIRAFRDYLQVKQNNKLRLLAISDGQLDDQERTMTEASMLAKEISGKFQINSQSVRFFTSTYGQPDTRGLAGILQFDSKGLSKLTDLNASLTDDVISSAIAGMFKDDGLDMNIVMEADKAVFKSTPWSVPSDKLNVYEGSNTIWLSDIPGGISINGQPVKVELHEERNKDAIYNSIKPKLDFYINKLRVLKVVNTEQSKAEIGQIMHYFDQFQKWIDSMDSDMAKLLGDHSLRGRLEYFKRLSVKKKQSFVAQMASIASDERVANLNSAQQADYLRSVDLNRNAKALARRAETYGLDFTTTVHKEVREMHKHLGELADIDDSGHNVSFYSQETTLSGIKAVCSLVTDGFIDEMDVDDVVQMINIVGVACNGPIGDFPDPMTWRVENLYGGCYLSLSDLLIAHIQSGGKRLTVPGIGAEITNVVPMFEDERVQRFMQKYCPSLLEYVCSIGMRRVIVGIPLTFAYTLCAGVWKLVELLNKDKSTVNIECFLRLLNSYNISIGKHFDHVLPYIKDQDPQLCYYVCNNGLTNMIQPLYTLIKSGKMEYIDRIIRSIYSYETYQLVKRRLKKEEDHAGFVKESLHKLLGIDLAKHVPALKPLFEEDVMPEFHNGYTVDGKLLSQWTNSFWYLDYVTLMTKFMEATTKDVPVEYIKSIKEMDNASITAALGIHIDLNTYKLYSLVQSLLYRSKPDRVDDAKEVMLVSDLGYKDNGDKMIREYVRAQYVAHWTALKRLKSLQEVDEAVKRMVNLMISCPTVDEFIELLSKGMKFGDRQYSIANTSSKGYMELVNAFLDLANGMPNRCGKLAVFMMGRTIDGVKVVWNGGNALFGGLKRFEHVFMPTSTGREIFAIVKTHYNNNAVYLYRDSMPNRHGHSNDKPSYFAFGYTSLEEMIQNISDEEWQEYKKVHHNCCGIKKL
jgi:hypothetical protein